MASTYSTSLKLTLIGDGDQSGIWGQTTNTNLGTLLEQAITGVVSVNMADANYTLTNFNGVTDEARNAVIVATGTNNAVRDLIPPVVEKLYTVSNQTTGGYAIRVIGLSGTGVTIPNGVTALVYCNGTNFYSGLSGTSGDFAVNGALGVTSNLAVTGATTLGAALNYGGVTLSNAVTGTGSMVLSASPALTGTPTSVTAANGTNTTQIATTAFVNSAVTGATGSLGTMSSQNANAVTITGGTLNGVTGTNAGLTVGTATSATTATSANQFQGRTKLGLGITGEVWNGVTSIRQAGQTYTNSNSYPIMFAVSALKSGNNNTTGLLEMIVDGVTITYTRARTGNNIDFTCTLSSTVIVPAGSTYAISLSGDTSLYLWNELY
jgi:hypothetical protein